MKFSISGRVMRFSYVLDPLNCVVNVDFTAAAFVAKVSSTHTPIVEAAAMSVALTFCATLSSTHTTEAGAARRLATVALSAWVGAPPMRILDDGSAVRVNCAESNDNVLSVF